MYFNTSRLKTGLLQPVGWLIIHISKKGTGLPSS